MFRTFLALLALSAPAFAQNFTTAAEVKPILAATKSNWVAVREYEGRDQVYFTQILSWRCGVSAITYSINGATPEQLAAGPCHTGTAAPNAILPDDPLPYISLPLGSVQSVSVVLEFDDGTTDTAEFARASVLMP